MHNIRSQIVDVKQLIRIINRTAMKGAILLHLLTLKQKHPMAIVGRCLNNIIDID